MPIIFGILETVKIREIAVPLSGKEMCKLFQKSGYQLVSGGKGSHMKLKKKGCPTVIIPDHKELRKGTECALKKLLDSDKKGRS